MIWGRKKKDSMSKGSFGLVVFYGISTLGRYLMPNTVYIYL